MTGALSLNTSARSAFGFIKRMVAVDIQSPRIHTFRFLAQFEVDVDVVLRNDPGTVGRAFECLFDRHSGNEVQVDVFGDIQNCLLYKERRIKV